MKKYKPLIICILIPLLLGALAWLLSGNAAELFDSIVSAPLSPPVWVFPVVWTVLYILMGYSSYLVFEEGGTRRCRQALVTYAAQLIFNFFWPFIFFGGQRFLLAFVWLVILWILVYIMIVQFFRCNKPAGCLQIPYLIWLTFAGCLNFMVWILNK